MKPSSKPSSGVLIALTLLAVVGTSVYSHAQTQDQAPRPARSRADEMLDRWNDIGNKLIAMAQDFPEDKYDFKVQKDERTFALNLLHAAALDYVLIRRISGTNIGPDFAVARRASYCVGERPDTPGPHGRARAPVPTRAVVRQTTPTPFLTAHPIAPPLLSIT